MAKITDEDVQCRLARRKKGKADPEEDLRRQLDTAKIPYDRQVKFSDTRKWKCDFLLRHHMVICEVDGGTWSRGKSGHNSGVGIRAGYERANAAQLLGYKIFRFTTDQVASGYAIETVLLAIGVGANKNNKKKGRR